MEIDSRLERISPMMKAIQAAYRAGQEDEALEPIVAADPQGRAWGRMKDGDYAVFYDIRGEREIQITESLIDPSFAHFRTKPNTRLKFVTMIEYSSALDVKVAFPPEGRIRNTLAETATCAGLKLCKIAESEKAVHVGYFMNGKCEDIFPGEHRVVVPSPENVDSYALRPEMSATQVTQEILKKLEANDFSFLIANLANVDVVGHIEDEKAVKRAVEAVDNALGEITAACHRSGVTLVVTADHGTVEEWLYPDGQVNTGHTKNRVPFVLADFAASDPCLNRLVPQGELAQVAPTILDLLGVEKPPEMTGESLLRQPPGPGSSPRRVLLLILDGWGLSSLKKGNLIRAAHTPHFDRIWSEFPHCELQASGEAVGMPAGTVGNSESGHLHLGAGRRILLDRVKIDQAIADGSFFRNRALRWAMDSAVKEKKALHLLGIVSHYSSHGSIEHLFALLQMARNAGLEDVFIHALIGRRGEKPESGAAYVAKVEERCRDLGTGAVVTVMGRFWALDREENWGRVEKAYRALVYGEGTPVLLDKQDRNRALPKGD